MAKSNSNPSKPILGYWDFRGLVNPSRLLLAYLGVDFEEVRIPTTLAGIKEWNTIKSSLGLNFPNLPYWIEPGQNGLRITESRAILKHLARSYAGGALMPEGEDLLTMAECVEGFLYDLGYLLSKRCIYDMENFIQDLDKTGPQKFTELETFLAGKTWLIGDKICYVDFFLYEVLYNYTVYQAEFLEPYPALAKFKANFEAIPQIKAYMASPAHVAGPCVGGDLCRVRGDVDIP